MKKERIGRVAFADAAILRAFHRLKSGRFEERELAGWLEKEFEGLEQDPFAGTPVQRRLWPREYVLKFGIDNLRKRNLPEGWRLLYTLRGDEVEIVAVVLEWCAHKDYEKRLGYSVG